MKEVAMPKYIDDPPIIAFWAIDEIIVMASLFGVGILMERLTVMLVVIFFANKGFRRFKESNHRGMMRHWLYWHGVLMIKGPVKNGLARLFCS